ncbi:MAG: ectoine hydroxylase-related dioxygenase (phytanoyl-CoA dioxygenase family) [Candidatus Endobugula sp.]|jgi:ectoine hydroxylase-related dioxygenase (phytanoyl-CoA dioxygenase family)
MNDKPSVIAPVQNDELSTEWDRDNQQWWNEYMVSADNQIMLDNASEIEAAMGPVDIAPVSAYEHQPVSMPNLDELEAELITPYTLDPMAIARFNRDGYVKLKRVLSPGALALLRLEMEQSLLKELGENPQLDFRSGEMMWLSNTVFRKFVLSPRIAEIAATLLGVSRVRLYHDNALAKEPGCGRTPWHYDKEHFPIASNNICTAWIPLQAIPQNMGPLAFAVGMENYQLVESIELSRFDTSYDRAVNDVFAQQGIAVDDAAFALGEISFHHAQSFHTARANNTAESRMVLATTYFEDGARVVSSPTMISGDWRKFMPNVGPNELIESPYNPVCFARDR